MSSITKTRISKQMLFDIFRKKEKTKVMLTLGPLDEY